MGWGRSSGTKRTAYRLSKPPAAVLRETSPGMGAGISSASGGTGLPVRAPDVANASNRDRRALPVYDVATGQDLESCRNLLLSCVQITAGLRRGCRRLGTLASCFGD